MLRHLAGLCIVFPLALASAPAPAQTARAAPEPARLLENEQIRVRELRLRPGEALAVQSFPNTFLYALTDGDIVFAPPGRTPYQLSFKAGEALWLSAQEAATRNESERDVRALIVEIRQRAPAAAATTSKSRMAKASGSRGAKLKPSRSRTKGAKGGKR